MTERELQSLIEDELRTVPGADAAGLAADVAHLAAAGLVEITTTPAGELTIAARDGGA